MIKKKYIYIYIYELWPKHNLPYFDFVSLLSLFLPPLRVGEVEDVGCLVIEYKLKLHLRLAFR